MHQLSKIIVPKVSVDWKNVAYALQYDIQTVKCITNNHNKDSANVVKSCLRIGSTMILAQ